MSVCTFLPQLAETPVEQSQDKAHEYGLDRLQYGWLEGSKGSREGKERDKNQPANQPKTNMDDGRATAGEGVYRETERDGGISRKAGSYYVSRSYTATSTFTKHHRRRIICHQALNASIFLLEFSSLTFCTRMW